MFKYVFKKIEINNFKYIKNTPPISIDFTGKDIVILSGQNGYGKTTIFDCIELLLTGIIKHFSSDLLNRGTESISILTNDSNKDIVIKGWLTSVGGLDVALIRTFKSSNSFLNTISWNTEEITQDELYEKLGISQSMFDMGMYISQSQSLNFLQNKYKNRKEQVSTLLENSKITKKIELLENIQQKLKTLTEKKLIALQSKQCTAEENVKILSEQTKMITVSSTLPVKNIKLFPYQEYPFDSDNFAPNTTYSSLIEPLKQIESFVKNYDEYINCIYNKYIDCALKSSPQVYTALFYAKQILVLQNNKILLEHIDRCRALFEKFKQHCWSIDVKTFLEINIPTDLTIKLKSLLEAKQLAQKGLNDTGRAITELTTLRTSLIRQFNAVAKEGNIDKNSCPLCGTNFLDIKKAFTKTEISLSSIHENGIKQVAQFDIQIEKVYAETIMPKIEQFLTQNHLLIKINDALNTYKNLSTNELSNTLRNLGIIGFASVNTDTFSYDEYTEEFSKLITLIKKQKRANTIFISDEKLELYKSIHKNYYDNNPPTHSLEQLQTKRQYIANRFLNDVSEKLELAKTNLDSATKTLVEYEKKITVLQDSMKALITKHNDARKDYQSLLASAIRLPLLIYSGKIIQNYPLGLGIKTVIKTNQMIFEAASRKNVDVYNILSTGQLNGLAIAILLSVRLVYGNTNGLDILLIDDPLQTIDDISAISLADILAQEHIGQIVLSTHEVQKANLLKFKFKQNNLGVAEIDMQRIYLSMNR